MGESLIFKIGKLIFKDVRAAFVGSLVFMFNLNILYLQATPMTELTLIVFFIISTYYLLKFLDSSKIVDLVTAAIFGYCATLSRYDGWFFVGIEVESFRIVELFSLILYNFLI